jgi:hypothetical protein
MKNKCVYKAWEAPKSNTESGTQEVICNNSDVKYRFESCPDYNSPLPSAGYGSKMEITDVGLNEKYLWVHSHWRGRYPESLVGIVCVF